ncbi:MAG: hypothetical protein AAF206_25460 [Bacteroidota bacterium]
MNQFSDNPSSIHLSDRRRWLEVAGVVLTGLGKFIFMDWLNWRLFYIVLACLSWAVYVFLRYRENPEILAYWGFRKDNFGKVFRFILPFGVVSVLIFWLLGMWFGTNILSWHIIPILILYPIWGTIQHFLMIGLVADNLEGLTSVSLSRFGLVSLTSILFAIVHYPHWWLILACSLLAVFYTLVYLWEKNLYVLGIFHGWLGALFFYLVLARDSFMEVMGPLLS